MNTWSQTGVTIGKFIGDKFGMTPNGLYLLINKPKDWKDWEEFFRHQDAFLFGYDVEPAQYMAVMKIPDIHTKAYEMFLQSKYSQMYTSEWLMNNMYTTTNAYPAYHVLAKSETARQNVITQFGLDDDFTADEYDTLWNPSEEIFNEFIFNPKELSIL